LERAGRFAESDEERIALRIDLDAAATCHGLSNGPPMFGQRIRVPRSPELVQQTRRPLDVREEEGDRPARQIAHGGPA
jgi:hypothetical protein